MASVIVMAVVREGCAAELVAQACGLVGNTLRPEQCGHHVTLALKPADPERFLAVYAAARYFECRILRYGPVKDGEICAVFGQLLDEEGQPVDEKEYHITLAGTVSPSCSKALIEGAASVPASGRWPVRLEVRHL